MYLNKKSIISNIRTLCALLRRDMQILKKELSNYLIDASIIMFTEVILFGKLFPLIGMPSHFVGPIYLGACIGFMIHLGYSAGLRRVFDLKNNRFIDYQMTLPLPKRWLFTHYVISFVIEAFIVTSPVMFVGSILLGSSVDITFAHIGLFTLIYLLTLLLLSIFFLAASIWYTMDYYRSHFWPRRLDMMYLIGVLFVTWYGIYHFSPWIAYLFLLNPITYPAEGMRVTLLASGQFIPIGWCLLGTCCSIGLSILFCAASVKKRLDPV